MAQNGPKGSKWNPYTEDEYNGILQNNSNDWHGGWVQGGNDSVHYVTGDLIVYSVEGSKQDPYTYDMYETIRLNHSYFWPGGWVIVNALEKRYYYDNTFCPEKDNEDNLLGSYPYPCSVEVFENMYDNGIWEGGYVLNLNGNGDIHYVNRNGIQNSSGSGEGCGSSSGGGSGSGCGSGSGGLVGYGNLTAGSANVSVNGMIVHLTWGVGTFNAIDPYPTLSCENSLGENVTASWSQPFFVSIAYGGSSHIYEIPQYYRS